MIIIYYFSLSRVCIFYCLKRKTFGRYPFYNGLQKNKVKKIVLIIVRF